MAKSTPSTAFTHVAPRPSSRWRTGKCFFSPRTSRTGEAIAHEPAPRDAAAGEVDIARFFGRAAGHRLGAARVEGAARREVGQVRRLAGDRVQGLLAPELRHRAEQGARVRMLGVVEQRAHGPLLDDL